MKKPKKPYNKNGHDLGHCHALLFKNQAFVI
jgi:hypothetical protein